MSLSSFPASASAGGAVSPPRGFQPTSAFARALLLPLILPLAALARPALTDLKVFPTDVNLTTQADRQSLVVQAVYADGVTRDVTSEAKYTLADAALARLDRATLAPLADGATQLEVAFAGRTLSVPVKVAQAKVTPPISFLHDVMPIFTKAGCNAGGCHGSSRGKDGFHLSLFGYDSDGDYYRITRQAIGRRINLSLPEESLLLEKAVNRVPHTGGKLFEVNSEFYRTLLAWLQAGAPKDKANVVSVERLEIAPAQSVLEGAGATQQLGVRAFYSDGTDRDVTHLTAFITTNDAVVKVSPEGRLTAGNRGEAFITARFDTQAVGVQVLTIPRDLQFTAPTIATTNPIDALVNAKLGKLRIAPSEVCDDATFLRRVYLDLVGLLPTSDEVRLFLADNSPRKRETVIDTLLDRREFTDIWVMKWAELLQVRSADQVVQMSPKSALQYFDWLDEQVSQNVPVDQMVRTLLTASGPSFENPAANFYKVERNTLKLSENVAQAFMGLRVQCAQCHNHPFDRWTMNDYYSLAAFFAQVGRKAGEDPRETIIYNAASGGVRHPVSGKDVAPRFLGGAAPKLDKGADRRAAFAEWLTAPDNPYFARNIANIVWAHFFGQGIVDPVDDVRVSNPPSNPELLEHLGARFVRDGYDMKKLVRAICTSRTYQLSSTPNATNAGDTRNFARGAIRRIRAEVLLDVLGAITASPEKLRGLPAGSRAVEIADGRTSNYFLTTFGRATRETPCSCEVKMEPNLSQALHLLNGDAVNAKVLSGGLVKKWLKERRTRDQIVEELYLRTLTRLPTETERTKLAGFFGEGKNEETVLNDLFWALLNAKEFVFNH